MNNTLHDQDFYAWTRQQTDFLKARNLTGLDIENLIEEITSLGERDKREVRSRLVVLLMHLLKWQYQPPRRSRSWRQTINSQRTELELLFDGSPSLRRIADESLNRCYELARKRAADETSLALSVFPDACPWACENVLESGFWP
jgi:hypothetical protein